MAEELRLTRIPDHETLNGKDGRSEKMTLEEALAAREQYLSEHPQLRAYQAEIDRTLQNVIGYENRMAVLAMMMQAKIYQLRDAVLSLDAETKRVQALHDALEHRDIGS